MRETSEVVIIYPGFDVFKLMSFGQQASGPKKAVASEIRADQLGTPGMMVGTSWNNGTGW